MAPQDMFFEEDEDNCPLCIEELDLSDRSFRPCPCGYQVCQFCFNNIKNNMNGLCPACRRPYDEKTIEWKVVTPEEVAEFSANIRKNQKKRALDQRQKEVQKREAEKENRKNLVGVRVVQKNLVYVTGLTPTVREDELLKTLRKPDFFGQYGNIQKISISNRKSSDGHNQSLGIYVTFEKKEDAQRCIQAVNGSQNGDRVLRAQLGTTKYCSAWLRHEQCTNRQCMFLHELGEEEDSYTRQDLSSMNSINTQRPLPPNGSSSRSASRQQSTPAPAPAPTPAAAPVAQPMARSSSKDESENGGDGSALPSSANWARNPQRSRRGSHATSGAAPSPAISTSLPVTAEAVPEAIDESPAEDSSAAPSTSSQSESSPSPVAEPAKQVGIPENILRALLKAMEACPFKFSGSDSAETDDAPPMFDMRGGEKRRAMREEEEARLAVDQEEQIDQVELSDGEPETGGSLALGGEPEDRDAPREAAFDQRRGSAQPPIQRGSTDGMFGPAIGSGYSQAASNAGSRSMTPQQQLYMRGQSGFGDHLPPGITPGQGSLAPQQQGGGHNRQGSRFSFANDNSGSSSMKVSANPRIMAQQSAMMPSSFHAQPGSQYYSSSMPGPPPGLKSTGTPPAMFGQGQAFGGAGFGAASKDSAELLQSLIRGRGAANSQAHDAAKPPASGLLASLYGNPPGAFQDFGPKQQKKKGKKHRHANTSSSGGGGLVDLADPSILQARMQHQSQGNAGVGQGLFGGQSQDDELPSLDEASSSVDALVSDDPSDSSLFIQGFGSSRASTATPGPPPGLGLSHRHPSPAIRTPIAASVVPAIPQQPVRVATPSASKTQTLANVVGSVTPDQSSRKKVPGSEAKKSIKALAVESGLSKDIAAHSPSLRSKKLLQEEDFPALDTVKSPAPKTIAPAVPAMLPAKAISTPTKKSQTEAKESRASSESKTQAEPLPSTPSKAPAPSKSPVKPPTKAAEKKPAPVLNIAAAVKAASSKAGTEASTASANDKSDAVAFPALPASSAATVASPSVKAAPKTLRVVNTPKVEVPPSLPVGVTLNAAARALSGAHRPDTPGSHDISDTASIVSTSISVSRTSSPPPSRIGSAPVRSNTKSQQRKARKEANKVAAIAEAAKPAEPEEHAPILGRKKKVKKEKPAASKPVEKKTAATPAATIVEPKPEDIVTPLVAKKTDTDKPEQKAKASSPANASQDKGKGKEKEGEKEKVVTAPPTKSTPTPPAPEPVAPAVEEPKDIGDNSKTTPEAVFHDLVSTGMSFAADVLQLLKPLGDQNSRGGDRASAAASDNSNPPPSTKSIVTEKDHAKLLSGKPVRKVIDGHRVLITPNGDCLRHLTEQEEQSYLYYQKRVAMMTDEPDAFVAPRHFLRGGGFSLIKGRAVPNGVPSFFPPPPSQQQRLFADDPVNKLQREEAISYINQFVLPRLNLGTSNLGFASNWKSYGNADSTAQGLTETKREIAAASLNTLAPWIYGHDAAAGAGIYSAESGGGGLRDVPEDETPFGGLDAAHPHPHPHGYGPGPGGPDGSGQQYPTKLPPLNGMSLMSVEEAETALQLARKETERLEKGLNQVIKRNRRLLLPAGR
ncbi:hypothetical protein ACHAQA_003092 [Verticillium albo-atrum]